MAYASTLTGNGSGFSTADYSLTSDLTNTDKSDNTQANYQVSSLDDCDYSTSLIETAEWTDKTNGEAEINIHYTAEFEDVDVPTRSLYMYTNCSVHGLTQDICINNILTLLEYNDYVDIIQVGASSDYDKVVTKSWTLRATDSLTYTDINNILNVNNTSDLESLGYAYELGSDGSGTGVVAIDSTSGRNTTSSDNYAILGGNRHVGNLFFLYYLAEYLDILESRGDLSISQSLKAIYLSSDAWFTAAQANSVTTPYGDFYGSATWDVLEYFTGVDMNDEEMSLWDLNEDCREALELLVDYDTSGQLVQLVSSHADMWVIPYYNFYASYSFDYESVPNPSSTKTRAGWYMLTNLYLAPAYVYNNYWSDGGESLKEYFAELLDGDTRTTLDYTEYGYGYGSDFDTLGLWESSSVNTVTLTVTISDEFIVDGDAITITNSGSTSSSFDYATPVISDDNNGNTVVSITLSNMSGDWALDVSIPVTLEDITTFHTDSDGFKDVCISTAVNAGQVITYGNGSTATVGDTATVASPQLYKATGSLTISKTISGSNASTTQGFEFLITLDDETINGEYGGATFSKGEATITLKAGETATINNLPANTTYTVAETNADNYTPTIDGSETDTASGTIAADATKTITFNNFWGEPSISITKEAVSADGKYNAGDKVTWNLIITNTGETTLTNVTITDALTGATIGSVSYPSATGILYVGESITTTVTYTLTQDDVNAGSIVNTATVTAIDKNNGGIVTDQSTSTINITRSPSISLDKIASIESIENAEAGATVVVYMFVITNTGNVTLSDFMLVDEKLGGDISDILMDTVELDPGENIRVLKSYTLTQADINSGEIYNTATITAKAPGDSTATDTDDVTVEVEQNPAIYLNKTASFYTVSDAVAGTTTITYTFVIKNTGNVTVNNITLSDDMLGGGITLEDTTLAPGKSTTVDKTYTLTQDDIDTGSIYNEATVTATPPSGSNISATDYATVKIEWSPALEVVKTSANGNTIQDATAGTVVTYEITVTNTGNVTLSNISVYDELDGVSIDTSNLMSTLSPSEGFTITAAYTLTQDDIDRGYVYNNAFVTSTTPDGTPIPENNDDETVELPSNPSIELVKTADVDIVESAAAGVSTITYMFTVTNTGNTTLSNIVLTDPLLGGEIELEETVLAPNASTFGTATYTVTQDDIDAGVITNTATVTGDDLQGNSVSNDSTEETDVEQLPAVDIAKEVMGDVVIENAYVGDWVRFAIIVTNTGNTTFYDTTITDLLEGAVFVVDELDGVTFNDNSVVINVMVPGDTVTVYVDYQLTQEDIDRGDTENIATVTATPPGDLEEVTDDDDAVIETPSDPSISLTKTANVESIEFALPGDVIYYTLTIANTGNTTINNLTLCDDLLGGDVTASLDKTTIAPGESATALLSYTLTQDDIDAGSVYNTAEATGEDPNGTSVDGGDDYTVELVANPSVTLMKTVAVANDIANEDLTTGDELTYTLVIANNGNQTINGITLYDELLGGETDLSNATKGIDMTVIGYIPTTDDETTVDDVSVDIISCAYYTEHTMVSADDPITTLRPGEYLLVELTYTITQDDMNNGLVDNTATVTAVDPNGNGISDENTATMYLPQHPEVVLVKEASQETLGTAEVGDLISYTLTITNTGDVPLTSITLVDELEGIIIDTGCLDGLTLDPGEATVVTAEYALTEADLETGSVYNHAVVTAESTVPYNEANTWSGTQEVSADDDALVDGIVDLTDELILSQTDGTSLIIYGGILIGLTTTACIITYTVGRRKKNISIK